MKNINTSPIFIHSLFRSGSTYIFKVFRHSQAGYWCYQEPLNEHLLYAANEPEKLLELDREMSRYLRHPQLDKPYFEEFYVIADKVGLAFRKEFSYEQYFSSDSSDITDLKSYFNILIDNAQGRPVFQCCRSAGRIAPLKSECGGVHIFLWRNPWDQWLSYKKNAFFDIRNLLIFNAKELPGFLGSLKKELKAPFLHYEENIREYNFKDNRHWLGAEGSYKLFYGLWCHAVLEAELYCDLSINIGELSVSSVYRDEILESLGRLGVNGLDFSDCLIPQTSYGESDGDFFLKVESYIHGLLLSHGYNHVQVGKLMQLSEARNALIVDIHEPGNSNVRDAMRAREYLRQSETELANHWTLLTETQGQLQRLDEQAKQLDVIKINLETELSQSENTKANLETELSQSENAKVNLKTALGEVESINVNLETALSKAESINVNLETALGKAESINVNLETEVDTAKEELSTLQKENQQITMTASRVDEELQAVYASKSWLIMARLRKIMHFLFYIARVLKSLAFTFTTLVMHYVIKQPQLKRLALDILNKLPRIKNILNKIALSAGLSTKESAYTNDLQNNISEQDTALTPTALQIYDDLKQVVDMKGN